MENKPPTPAPRPNTNAETGETAPGDLARQLSCTAAAQCLRPFHDHELSPEYLAAFLRAALTEDPDGADLLHRQTRALDLLFSRLTMRALQNPYPDTPQRNIIDHHFIHLALRAQQQSRDSLHALNLLAQLDKAHSAAETENAPQLANEVDSDENQS